LPVRLGSLQASEPSRSVGLMAVPTAEEAQVKAEAAGAAWVGLS